MQPQFYLLFYFFIACSSIKAQQSYFPPTTGTTWDTLAPSVLGYCPDKVDSLYQYLEQTDTKAFILLKDGKIVLERYFDTFTQDSVWYWASAGKSLTACLAGIAQQEGYLSIEDTTSQYLGMGWTTMSLAQEQAITIKDQLSMTTGLNDGGWSPDCTVDTCLQYLADAGTRWAYHNAPYTLLDQVIAQATGRSINTYLFQKIKQTTGMTGAYVPLGYNNVYFSKARSMARFGLFALNKGHWNGIPVLADTSYFREMTTPSQNHNPAYGYLWWLNGQQSYQLPNIPFTFNGALIPNAPSDLIMALGKNGQAINVVPSQGVVWIRMGNAPGAANILHTYNDSIWIKINALDCATIATTSIDEKDAIQLFPNPAMTFVQVASSARVQRWQLFNSVGQLIKQEEVVAQNNFSINLLGLTKGCYYLSLWQENGQKLTHQIIKK
ncbi:MAG: serine hydrolase [Aureispira sp.]